MSLKVAAVDKNWLQQTVLSERRRLAGLHKAALVRANAPNTETAKLDHKDDLGYEGSLSEAPLKAPKVAAFTTPDAAGVEEVDIEAVNIATEHLEDAFPSKSPEDVANAVHAAWTPGMSVLDLISAARKSLVADAAHAASTKKADVDPNTKQAEDDHKGDAAYETALKEASTKKAAELKVDDQGNPPNTSTATSDHADELKALAAQLASFKGNLAFPPNDPLKD